MSTPIIPPGALPYLAGFAAINGLVPTAIGILTLFDTRFGHKILDLPNIKDPKDAVVINGLLLMFGARDLAIGLTTIATWYLGCKGGRTSGYPALGSIMLGGALMTVVDGMVARRVNGRGEWGHWSFTPVLGGIGLALVGLV